MISFIGEVKKVESRKTASLDVEHRVTFASDDVTVSELSKLNGDSLVKVTIEVIDG